MTNKASRYSDDGCYCNDIIELEGVDAQEYCSNHLKRLLGDDKNWQTTYVCPVTDIQWLKDYPHGEYHGGGGPRLRKLPLHS